jgi:hypothetical protein
MRTDCSLSTCTLALKTAIFDILYLNNFYFYLAFQKALSDQNWRKLVTPYYVPFSINFGGVF